MTLEEVQLKRRGGGDLCLVKPIFSSCGESIFIARNNTVLEYSTKTSLLIAQFRGLEETVAGLDIVTINSVECLIACSTIGEIIVWKIVTRFKVLTKKLKCANIQYFRLITKGDEEKDLEAIISWKSNKKLLLAKAKIAEQYCDKFKIKFESDKVHVGIGSDFLAITNHTKIHFLSTRKSNTVELLGKYERVAFTCVECHSEEEIAITGDAAGKVILWHNIFNKNPARSTFHWHTLPVNCLSFSPTGSYFYSGADERVLVRWDWTNSDTKKFLPRLPGYIQHVSVSNHSQFVAVTTSDNAVKIVDSAFNNVSLIQHLVIGENFQSGIVLDPRTKSLVMNGTIGQVQFYNPINDTLLYSMDVVGQNKLTNERNSKIENTKVTKFAISKSGHWLATFENRPTDPTLIHKEMRMKFWRFNDTKQSFELSTSIERPHEQPITAMEFQYIINDDDLKLVTVGDDKKFKIWHQTTIQQVNVDKTVWNCFGSAFYRNLTCRGLSFSAEGSLMAIGFGAILTAWTSETCELKCSLVSPLYKDDIKEVQFGTSNLCHLVVTATDYRVSVWNLLTLTLIWTVPIYVDVLLADKMSTFMALLTKDKELFIFSPDSPHPVYSNNTIISDKEIVAAALLPTRFCMDSEFKWYERVELYFIDNNKELFSLSSNSEDDYDDDYSDELITKEGITLYNKMIPFIKTSKVVTEQKNHMFKNEHTMKNIRNYLEAPVHTMLPIRFICGSLIKSLVIEKNKK